MPCTGIYSFFSIPIVNVCINRIRVRIMWVKGVSAGRVLVLIQAASLRSAETSTRPAPRKELRSIESTTDAGFRARPLAKSPH